MQMHRDYRLAAYAVAVSALLLTASGAAVVADGSAGNAPSESSPSETESNETTGSITVTNSTAFEVTTVSNDSGTVTFDQATGPVVAGSVLTPRTELGLTYRSAVSP